MFNVELILHSARRIDCVAERACYTGYSADVREI
jgi:hypothetical protein